MVDAVLLLWKRTSLPQAEYPSPCVMPLMMPLWVAVVSSRYSLPCQEKRSMRAASDSQGWGSAHHAIALDFALAKRSGGRSGDPKGPSKAAAECSEVLGTGWTSTLC